MSDDYWARIPVDANQCGDAVFSINKVQGWWIIVHILDTHTTAHETLTTVEINCTCSCEGYDLRRKEVEIPVERNSITVQCANCFKHILRVSGLITREWSLQVPKDFL